jgi:hypothetical protein
VKAGEKETEVMKKKVPKLTEISGKMKKSKKVPFWGIDSLFFFIVSLAL